jgi:effector-binding domain-containing protein
MNAPEKKTIPLQTVISMQHQGSYAEIGKVYHELREWANKIGARPAGHSFTLFLTPPNEFDPASSLFEVCMPVQAAVAAGGKVKVKKLPSCTVAAIRVKGPYSEIPAHYSELLAWLSAEGWEVTGPSREVYIKHPDAQGGGNPKEFVTEIQFPISE